MKRILLAIFTMLVSAQAFALSLGQIQVSSGLNERFEAVVPLTASNAAEIFSLQVTLASNADHARRHISLSSALSKLHITVINDPKAPYLRLSTPNVIREPALKFILDASWKGGRVLRSYSVLLNLRNTHLR